MKLVFRVTLAIFLFLTISSTAIGYFAITKYQSSLINLVDHSLDSKIRALVATKEDPLTVAQYLAQTSSIPVTVEYLTDTGMVTVLTVSGPDIPTTPSASTLFQASHVDVNYGADLRIRVFAMPDGKKLILAASLALERLSPTCRGPLLQRAPQIDLGRLRHIQMNWHLDDPRGSLCRYEEAGACACKERSNS